MRMKYAYIYFEKLITVSTYVNQNFSDIVNTGLCNDIVSSSDYRVHQKSLYLV